MNHLHKAHEQRGINRHATQALAAKFPMWFKVKHATD